MGCSPGREVNPNAGSTPEGKKEAYVINGFYMSLREKFVGKDASIYAMQVEWDEKDLSWEDFRGVVLGATDPTKAAAGSLRKTILDDYKKLGLKSVPNMGDNGVHASASPFEGLCERLNWCGAKVETDNFGKALLDLGIDAKTIATWTKDPQVEYDGKKGSLFDSMEDTNASDCLKIAKAIAKAGGEVKECKNMALVFVKPHANVEAVQKLVKDKFAEKKITIVMEKKIDGVTIDSKKLIDNHYYSIANKAVLTNPKDLTVPDKGLKAFQDKFGLSWEEALKKGLVFNAKDAADKSGKSGSELEAVWGKAKDAGNCIKFGGGFYCAKLEY